MATRWQSAGFIEFELDFAGTDIHHVSSDDFSAGEHVWRVKCYPLAEKVGSVIYLSLVLGLTSDDAKCDDVDAILDAFLLGGDHGARAPSSSPHAQRSRFHLYPPKVSQTCGSCVHFMKWIVLDSESVTDGYVTFMVGVKVLGDCPIPVPSSDIGKHLGHLLDHADGSTDVTFSVGAETFRAHSTCRARRPLAGIQSAALRLHGERQDAQHLAARHPARDVPGLAAVHVHGCVARRRAGGELFRRRLVP
jgi:speckle-type POZ protein